MGLVYFIVSLTQNGSIPAENASLQWIHIQSIVVSFKLGFITSEFKKVCVQFGESL